MKKISVSILSVCLVFILFLLHVHAAEKAKYVGAETCKMCHSGPEKGEVYEKWEKSAHKKAFESLGQGWEENDICLDCHVTGFFKGGYKLDTPGNEKFKGIQCETCHGPGGDHVEMVTNGQAAKENGMGLKVPKPSEDLCNKCHLSSGEQKRKNFNVTEAMKLIDHKYSKK